MIKKGSGWFKSTAFGDEKDRILIRSTGEPTYRLPDIAYHCDLTIAAHTAIFGQNGPRVGSPAGGYIVSHAANVLGHKRARELWMLCRRYTAQQALDWGLANSVVPKEKLDEEVRKLIELCHGMNLRWSFPPYPVGWVSRETLHGYVEGNDPVSGARVWLGVLRPAQAERVAAWREVARRLSEQGKPADAIKLLEMLQEFYPNSTNIDFQIADAQIAAGNRSIMGAMIESNLEPGSQPFPQPLASLRRGVSITDACIGWSATEDLVRRLRPHDGIVAPLAVFLASDAAQDVSGQIFAVRANEIFLMSQSRPLRSVHRAGGWTPQDIAEHGMPALKSSFFALDRTQDVFTWDPL